MKPYLKFAVDMLGGRKMNEVSIIGAGFVGAAHAAFLSQFYDKTNLIDKNVELVTTLGSGLLPFSSADPRLTDLFSSHVQAGKIRVSSDISKIQKSKIIFISIGFDFSSGENGYDNLTNLIHEIVKYASNDCMIVLETTVPPGMSEKVVLPLIKKRNLNYVYSYERVMPGPDYLKSVEELPKIYASIDDKSAQLYETHLALISQSKKNRRLCNIVSAEASKVFENTYRMLNIAIVQEFTEYALHVGADLPEILECIRARPTHSNIRYAGLAPGGYCLTKDPNFLISSSVLNEFDFDFPILTAANEVVARQNEFVLQYLLSEIDHNTRFDFLGVSYLAGVGDLRGSSALWLYKKLISLGHSIECVDPYCVSELIAHKIKVKDMSSSNSDNAIIATRHPEFGVDFLGKFRAIYDINSCLSSDEKLYLRKIGVTVRQYGENL